MGVKVLSIDGGGIKGIIPAKILKYIEDEIRVVKEDYHLVESFNLIAGTSTGGIIALGLLSPGKGGKPKFLADDLLQLYVEKGNQIFDTDVFRQVVNPSGLFDELYSKENIEKLFKKYFDDIKLSELLKPCLIPSYNIFDRSATFFNTTDVLKGGEYHNYYVRDIARATSAAPTYFEPANIQSLGGDTHYPLVDGGVFANNPAMCALVEVCKALSKVRENYMFDLKEITLISLGTGINTQTKKSFEYNDAKNWGKLKWASPIIDIMMSASSETIDYQLRQIFANTGNSENYVRIQPELKRASPNMDDTQPVNIDALLEDADAYIAKNTDHLKKVIEKIIN